MATSDAYSSMSLTQMVSTPTPIKDALKTTCPKPRLRLKADLKVAPVCSDRALIGTAFDYLLRFQLARWNRCAIAVDWVAEAAVDVLGEFGDSLSLETAKGRVSSAEVCDRMRGYVLEARQLAEKFEKNGNLSDELVRSTIRLAQCDVFYRALQLHPQLGRTTAHQVRELRALMELVKRSSWRAKSHCLLNPNFGRGSKLIGGADADVLLDDLLIEIKTTAALSIKAADWRQLFAYAALNEHFPIGNDGVRRRIRRLGVYFARYGVMHTWSIEDVLIRKEFRRLAQWICDHLRAAQSRPGRRRRKHDAGPRQRRVEA